MFNHLIADLSPLVKGFWQAANIWRSYGQE